MKKGWIVFVACAAAASFGMAGCGEKPTDPFVSAVQEELSSQVVSYTNESQTERNRIASEFTRAYLSGDKEQLKGYLDDPGKAKAVYSGATPEDMETVFLQAISKMQPDGSYDLTCGFEVADIPGKQYLDMHFENQDGRWKVTEYHLQA